MSTNNFLNSQDAKALYEAIQSLETDVECKNFLRDLLTEAEIKECIMRWRVDKLPTTLRSGF